MKTPAAPESSHPRNELRGFPAIFVRALLEASQAAERREPSFSQYYDKYYWRNDMDPAQREILDTEMAVRGFAPSVREEDIDRGKIPAGLWLVGDHGIYLMANAPIKDVKEKLGFHVEYAAEANPETMSADEVWDAKCRIFGGDDGSEFLPVDLLMPLIESGSPRIIIDIKPDGLSFHIPPVESSN